VEVINAITCEPDGTFASGAFHSRVYELTERLGARVIGASVWEVGAGFKGGPYHYHPGVEEWLYAVSGAPVLRTPEGERTLAPGELVAFAAGPEGAHTVHGPGRVVMFSAGDRGWGEAFASVYPDSGKIAAAGPVMFRLADALEHRRTDAAEAPLGGRTWSAARYELAPGEAAGPYHYEWCRENWALVLGGTPTLRHAEGETGLRAGDVCCFPQGPAGAHRLSNAGQEPAEVVVFTSPIGRPMSAVYPDEGQVLIDTGGEQWLFRHADRIESYWEGEPGAAQPIASASSTMIPAGPRT
jgi:uncharacterized cupin superfamily protein